MRHALTVMQRSLKAASVNRRDWLSPMSSSAVVQVRGVRNAACLIPREAQLAAVRCERDDLAPPALLDVTEDDAADFCEVQQWYALRELLSPLAGTSGLSSASWLAPDAYKAGSRKGSQTPAHLEMPRFL